MSRITAAGKTFECERGANLRQVLLKNGVALHNGQSKIINCKGIGTCGTCAVQVEGEVTEAGWRETARRALPPHSLANDRRLACQTCVLGDVKVSKFDGFWGEGNSPNW